MRRAFCSAGSATLGTMRLIGRMLVMAITMVVLGLSIGNARITTEYHPLFVTSMRISFIIFSARYFRGIFASLTRGKVR